MITTELAEHKRREDYLRADTRPFNWIDPLTWSYPYKTAGFTSIATLAGFYYANLWYKKPIYFRLVPGLIATALIGFAGYWVGKLRVHHYQTRDAVLEHYISLHPEDFDHLKNYNGRPYSQILLPWYPVRTEYTKLE